MVFDLSDYDYNIDIPNSIVFRTSQYRYKNKKNEFIIPPLVEDLGGDKELVFGKKSNKPVVGFAGWADFPNFKQRARYEIKNFALDLKSFWNPYAIVHKQGLYFRRKSIEVLKKSDLIETNFILRKSYSAHADTIELDPRKAREEYIQNILNSDFVLAPKGDGNYSARFYEALSLGRIPILIDTETTLPLEGVINYDSFILRVRYRDIGGIDKIIADFYNKLSNEEFIKMQKLGKEMFKKYLRSDKFYYLL